MTTMTGRYASAFTICKDTRMLPSNVGPARKHVEGRASILTVVVVSSLPVYPSP